MELWREHLLAEHKDLSERLAKLNKVLATGGHPVDPAQKKQLLEDEQAAMSVRLARLNAVLPSVNLPDSERALLIAQAFVMTDYLEILEKRIAS